MTDILERLADTFRAEPAALRAIDDAAAEIERLREWNAEIALNAREFAAENERLRAALEWIAGTALTEAEAMAEKARAALEGRT